MQTGQTFRQLGAVQCNMTLRDGYSFTALQ